MNSMQFFNSIHALNVDKNTKWSKELLEEQNKMLAMTMDERKQYMREKSKRGDTRALIREVILTILVLVGLCIFFPDTGFFCIGQIVVLVIIGAIVVLPGRKTSEKEFRESREMTRKHF